MQLRRAATPANVIATIALVLAAGGTSYAAATITGAHVKDNSLTGADVKNRSLTKADLSTAAISQLRGPAGAAGPKGSTGTAGPKGDTGAQGSAGKDGAAAQLVSSYAQERPGTMGAAAGFDRYVSPVGAQPNSNAESWHVYDNQAEAADLDPADAIDGRVDQPPLNGTLLNNIGQTNLLSLTDGQTNGGVLSVNYNSYLTGTAAITLLHKGTHHLRAECQLFVSDGASLTPVGEPVWASSNIDHQMVTVSLVGTATGTASASSPKQYNIVVRCRNGDKTPNLTDDWEYVRGNLTAYAASR